MQSKSVFTQIIERKIPANILYEDDKVIAFYDINPVTEGHFLVVPKSPEINILENSQEDYVNLLLTARKLAKESLEKNGFSGFKLQINTGESAGQVVFHTHVHIIPYK
ncbi:HIT family protein [Mycoplasmopsis bovirhinis]|uniref:Histidine triad nucleotide-binding (HIT-like) protein n=1 Tax=Mycoplasmopsis bovirhinis TaxID=29553 RepID=A0A224AS55_9BACT|nr:HIT domain-containing protein [Mycoplasmopsis bovirhinis]BBA22261.1 HIT family protein [Mycoplasmopsis bovirhinis]VEU63470.1 Histidine triad nucleotide-binding (HIT-like) protein [Mycoplasmopsis bovirhinis]